MLAVVDTNIWISGLLAPEGFAARVIAAMADGRVTPVYCEKTLAELKDTYTSPGLNRRYRLSLLGLNQLISVLMKDGREMPNPPEVRICRDIKDDVFVALALSAGADYLVSRDDDLKRDIRVQEYLRDGGVVIATLREFLTLLDRGTV